MQSNSPHLEQPDIPRFFARRLFSWRTLRRTAIVLTALATLVVALVTEENWRGRRAWENYKADEEAKGEKFDLASFTRPPVPADQNFAATPVLAPLVSGDRATAQRELAVENVSLEGGEPYSGRAPSFGNWRRGEFCNLAAWQSFYSTNTNFVVEATANAPAAAVLSALKKYEPVISELTAASQRRYAILPFRQETITHLDDSPNPFSILKALTRVFTLRALANLQAGHASEALSDIKVVFRLAECLEEQPTLIVHMVRMALLETALQPVWEGLAKKSWNDAQLKTLETLLRNTPMLARYGGTMRGERAFGNALFEEYRKGETRSLADAGVRLGIIEKFTGKAVLYQNQIALNRLADLALLPAVDADAGRVYVEKANTNVIGSILSKPNPYNMLAWMSAAALIKSPQRFARVQTSLDLAAVACALERYRLAHQAYPEALDALAPEFISKVPLDVIDGKPLRFRRENNRAMIYSVGWNQTDDGGEIPPKQDFERGDWVWPLQPADLQRTAKVTKE